MQTKAAVIFVSVCAAGIVAASFTIWLAKQRFEGSLRFSTPESISESSAIETRFRIEMALQSGSVPETIADLPFRPGYANRTQDGWGRQVQFSVERLPENKYRIRVFSAGPDGAFGSPDDIIEEALFPK